MYALRRQWATHLAVSLWLEHVAYLTRQMPNDVVCRLDDGAITMANYRFDMTSDGACMHVRAHNAQVTCAP
jgi:carbohydrate-binding DOMON domain-containing protein